jgi:predicted phosphoribosyltransferase
MHIFRDRIDAGRMLARQLVEYERAPDTVVLGLPRGGVPVAREVVRMLQLPLDVLIVRKIGAPGAEELAVGAIASGGIVIWNEDLRSLFTENALAAVVSTEQAELARRERIYRGTRPPLDVAQRRAIVVDDGAATGASMRAAVQALRLLDAREVIVGLPVASEAAVELLRGEADRVYCVQVPDWFDAVGRWYRSFPAVSDAEVIDLLRDATVRSDDPASSRKRDA